MRVPFWVPSLWVGTAVLLCPNHLWLALVGYHAICLGGAFQRRAWAPGRMDGTAGIWTLMALGLMGIALLLPSIPGFPVEAAGALFSQWPGGLRGQAVYAMAVNAPLEEAYWRGALLDDRRGWTLLQHGLAFGLHHGVAAVLLLPWPWALPAFLVPALAGAAWAWLARRNGGIVAPVLLHALSDLAILAFVAHQLKAAL